MRPALNTPTSRRELIQRFSSVQPVEQQLHDLLQLHHAHVIFKHSPHCGLSLQAYAEVERYAAARDALPVTLVDVLAQRSLSQMVSATTTVRHESPQVLLVRDGVVQWHASHRGVTADGLREASLRADRPAPPPAA